MDTRERSVPSLEDHVRYHYNVYYMHVVDSRFRQHQIQIKNLFHRIFFDFTKKKEIYFNGFLLLF